MSGNIVSFPKIKEEDSLIRMVSMSSYSVPEDLTKQFMKQSIPELEPEPIPSCSWNLDDIRNPDDIRNLDDIRNRDAMALDQDVVSFLARFA